MGRIVLILGILTFAMTFVTTQASAGVGTGDGHAFEWFRDADGDGIPNGLDDDWFRPEDGDGFKIKHGFGLFGLGAFWGNGEGGKVDGNQYRHRKNQPDDPGDCLRIRQQLRDGSCE